MVRRNLLPGIIALLLTACVAAVYLTQEEAPNHTPAKKQTQPSLTDQRLLRTAHETAAVAETVEETELAREALHLADHELDQEFTTALREASLPVEHKSGPLKEISDRIAENKAQIAAGQARIAKLTKLAETKEDAADQLELAKAQLTLDQDELEDARQDLARAGGDQHAKLERALQEHQSSQHNPQPPKPNPPTPAGTMVQQLAAWFSLDGHQQGVNAALRQATGKLAALSRQHDALEKAVSGQKAPANLNTPPATPDPNEEEEDTADVVARLRKLSDQRKTLTEFDKRIQDTQQLIDVYKRWGGVLETRRRGVLHLLLRSLAGILVVILAVLIVDRAIRRAFRKQNDPRRMHQMRVIATVGVQAGAAIVILLIFFGVPTQTSTLIGLATAGLTVVLKDFIVAFFGWFTLIGKNGIRIGDWVEIEGVGGEVIEIGILKTVLLEMGNWTDTGHPTGRHVSFVNKYAIEGHFFNFSTAGQWLWDQLQVRIPPSGEPYKTAELIRQIVERETAADAKAAELDWERVTKQYGTKAFSAKPTIDLRPMVNGIDVNVRYITHAPERHRMKSRLFEAIVDLLHGATRTTGASID